MLKKNIPPNFSSCSVQVQTEEFLLYLCLEQRLSQLLQEYQALEQQYRTTKDLLQYHQFKANLLQNSLHELTFTFSTHLSYKKLELIDQISKIDELIQQEKKEISVIQQSKQDNQPHQSKQQSKQTSFNSSAMPEETVSSGIISPKQSFKLTKHTFEHKKSKQSELYQIKSLSNRNSLCSSSSQNQFLDLQVNMPIANNKPPIIHSNNRALQELPMNNCLTERPKKCSVLPASGKHNKQNLNIARLMKKQAQLNLRNFLYNFNSSQLPLPAKTLNG